jgi:hypothetical protein
MSLARRAARALAVCLLLAGPLAPGAAGAVLIPMTFSGGSGSPLTITLPQPVSYTLTTPPAGGILFDFKGLGNLFGGTVNVSGTMTYAVNAGPANTITAATTGAAAGAITATDVLLFHNPATAAALADTILLSAGSVTTAVNVAAAPPANGGYLAILVDQSGNQVATGVGVPEPASVSILAALGALTLVARRRRRRTA